MWEIFDLPSFCYVHCDSDTSDRDRRVLIWPAPVNAL